MLIRNIRSIQDLEAKRALAKQLLQLEVDNEAENERRVADYQNPYKPKEVPPQYKTTAEMQKDRLSQEKEALANLETIGIDYNNSAKIVAWLSSSLINRLIDFNANFKGIKKDLTENTNPKLLSPEYIEDYLERYFEDLDVNYGRKFAKPVEGGVEDVKTIEELSTLFPSEGSIEAVIIKLEGMYERLVIMTSNSNVSHPTGLTGVIHEDRRGATDPRLEELKDLCRYAIVLLRAFEAIIPSDALITEMKLSLNQQERAKFIRAYSQTIKSLRIITDSELREILDELTRHAGLLDNIKIVKKIIKSLATITSEGSAVRFEKIARDFLQYVAEKGTADPSKIEVLIKAKQRQTEQARLALGQFHELLQEENEVARQREDARLSTRDMFPLSENQQEIQQEIFDEAMRTGHLQETPTANYDMKKLYKDYFDELDSMRGANAFPDLNNLSERLMETIGELSGRLGDVGYYIGSPEVYETGRTGSKKLIQANPEYLFFTQLSKAGDEIQRPRYDNKQLKDIVEQLENEYIRRNPDYDPLRKPLFKPTGFTTGLGLEDKVIKHFAKDEKDMKKLANAFKKHKKVEKEVDSSDSDSDSSKRGGDVRGIISRPKIPTLVGVGFKASRIGVKAKVGKGVSVNKSENPTYRSFGKYVIHVPHLLNNNMANFKYPSLGSIPSIKPVAVSEDYKEFLVDILNKGNMDDKVLKHLPPNEIKHFEKVCIGAGLVEKFKLKVGSNDEDKKDLARFEVLKGEYNAGNNSDKLLKELRLLIVKFMNNGRIHRSEGLNLLMELSTI